MTPLCRLLILPQFLFVSFELSLFGFSPSLPPAATYISLFAPPKKLHVHLYNNFALCWVNCGLLLTDFLTRSVVNFEQMNWTMFVANNNEKLLFIIFNSRTAIAGAIIGLLLFFYNSKNLNCIGALSFFYDSKRSIGEVLFLINFIGVNFEAGNEKREKIRCDLVAEQKWRAIWLLNKSEERSEVVFCSYRCFWESEKLMCEKIFYERSKFLFTCGI